MVSFPETPQSAAVPMRPATVSIAMNLTTALETVVNIHVKMDLFVRQEQSIPPTFATQVTFVSMARSESALPENINLVRATPNVSTVQPVYNAYQIPPLQSLVNVLLDPFVMALAQVNPVPLEHIVILPLVRFNLLNAYLVHMVTFAWVVLVNSQVIQCVTMGTNVTKVPNLEMIRTLGLMATTVFKARNDHVMLDHIPLYLELPRTVQKFVTYVPLGFTVPVRVSLNYVLRDIIAQRDRSFLDSNAMLVSFVLKDLQRKSTVLKVQKQPKFIKASVLTARQVFIVPRETKPLLSMRTLIISGEFSN